MRDDRVKATGAYLLHITEVGQESHQLFTDSLNAAEKTAEQMLLPPFAREDLVIEIFEVWSGNLIWASSMGAGGGRTPQSPLWVE